MILAALAFAAGAGRAAFGAASAGKQGRSERDQIKRAYQIGKRRTNEAQAYTRQGMNESLNARGILNGGADPGRSSVIKDAYAAGDQTAANRAKLGAVKKGDITGELKVIRDGGDAGLVQGGEEARMAADAERGQSGDGGTLSGQANSDLSREFYGEHQDLYSQRQQAIAASKRAQSAGVAESIAAGIDVGKNVYAAGSMIKDAFGAPTTPAAAAPSAGQPGYTPAVTPGSWFGNYDPTDPLGFNKRRNAALNSDFNVNDK